MFLSKSAGSAALSWAAAAGATGYHVYRGANAGFLAGNPAPWTTPAAEETTDSDVPSPIFYYLVRATDGIDESSE